MAPGQSDEIKQTRPDIIEYKYNHTEDFKQLGVRGKERGSSETGVNAPIPRAYSTRLPICEAKRNDLLSLCKNCVKPKELHPW